MRNVWNDTWKDPLQLIRRGGADCQEGDMLVEDQDDASEHRG